MRTTYHPKANLRRLPNPWLRIGVVLKDNLVFTDLELEVDDRHGGGVLPLLLPRPLNR